MNSWDPSFHKTSTLQAKPTWVEVFMPVSAFPLLLVLFLILPIFLLAAESLLSPVLDYIKALLIPVNVGMAYTTMPLILIFKIIIFSFFAFTGVGMLLLKISCLYHEVWSHFFHQPHPKHTVYHPNQQDSMVALFNWSLFRWYKVLGPFAGWFVLTVLAGAFSFWLFDIFTSFGVFSFQLEVTFGFFVVSILSFLTVIAFFKGIWGVVTTALGDVVAITEPEKATQVVFERAQKVAFKSPLSLFLYPLYLLFYLAVITEAILLVTQFDISDLLSFNGSILTIYGIEFITLTVFFLLSAMKFMTYHDALGRYYQRYIQ